MHHLRCPYCNRPPIPPIPDAVFREPETEKPCPRGIRSMEGVRFRITSPARTIVDCSRFRNKIGLDVALEALNDGLGTGAAAAKDITRPAQACQAWTVIKPYLESTFA
jgi:hypothetical protein